MKSPAVSCKRHRFPQEIISNAVWLYFGFPLSLHLVEEMLPQRFISNFSALRNLFITPRHKRSALATHIHRIRAMAHSKAVTCACA
jgi:hypothetical protein